MVDPSGHCGMSQREIATQAKAYYDDALYTAGTVAANLLRDYLNGQEQKPPADSIEVALAVLTAIERRNESRF